LRDIVAVSEIFSHLDADNAVSGTLSLYECDFDKRRTLFLEHLLFKRTKSRRDVYMQALKEFYKKEIYDLDDKDVLDYLMFKDVNDSGRTIIHHHACPNVGNSSPQNCPDLVKCSLRHSANSMRIGIRESRARGRQNLEFRLLPHWGYM